jgi:hypothetical protein
MQRILAAVEQTDVRRCAGQEWAVLLECKSLLGHVTPSPFRSLPRPGRTAKNSSL